MKNLTEISSLERISITTLAVSICAYGIYFLSLLALYQRVPVDVTNMRPLLLTMAALFVVALIISQIVVAVISARSSAQTEEPADERDWLFWAQSGSKSIHVLYLGLMVAIGLALFEAPLVVIANLLVATMALCDVLRMILLLNSYREGA